MEIAHNAHVKVALALNMHSALTQTPTMRRSVGERNCGCVVYDTPIDSRAATFLGCRWCVSKRWKFPSPQGQKQTPHQKRKWFFLPHVRPRLKIGWGWLLCSAGTGIGSRSSMHALKGERGTTCVEEADSWFVPEVDLVDTTAPVPELSRSAPSQEDTLTISSNGWTMRY